MSRLHCCDVAINTDCPVRGNSTEILNLDGVLSGIAAAQYSLGAPGIFDFNGAKYNVSTGMRQSYILQPLIYICQ